MTKKWLYIVLAVLILAALAILVFQPFGRQNTPSISLPSPQSGQSSAEPVGALEVNPDTVQTALKALSVKTNYSHGYTVTTSWGEGSGSEDVFFYRKDDSVKIVRSFGATNKDTLFTNGKLYIWYEDDPNSVYSAKAGSISDADDLAGLIAYEELLELPSDSISAAKYVTENNASCIYVKYTGSRGYTYELYISVNTGILITAGVYDGNAPVYTLETSFISLSPVADSVFQLPAM